MADLATVADLVDRVGDLTDSQVIRAPALLADASALVRGYTRQTFDLVTGDVVVLRPVSDHVRLPQRPVLAVSDVALIDCDGQPGGTVAFCWDGSDKVRVGGHIAGFDWFWPYATRRSVQVTYDHGYATPPADVVAVVANMVNRVLTAPTLTEGLTAENIGQYGYQTQQGVGSMGAGVRLLPSDKSTLSLYRRQKASTIMVSI